MKVRFEVEIPEIVTEENPSESFWRRFDDAAIEEGLSDYAFDVVYEHIKLKVNQDDLKEFIKAVRELENKGETK
jgi:hypothetical protein